MNWMHQTNHVHQEHQASQMHQQVAWVLLSCGFVSYFELHELRASCDTAGWVKSQNKEAGFCIEERDREGWRRGGRLEPSFSIRCFAPLSACLTSLTRPTLRIVRPQWRRHNKRGSVRQKLVWVAIYSVMVGSESKVEALFVGNSVEM